MTHAHAIRPRNLMWLPAALLLAWGVVAALGYSVTPTSFGASTGNSSVTATVALDIHIAGTCPGYTNAYGAMADGVEATLGTCGIEFGTNNGASSTLKVESARDNAGQVMFCRAADNDVNCGGSGFSDVGTNAVSLADDEFGVLSTVTNCTAPTWQNARYNPVPPSTFAGAGTTICTMTGTVDGEYTLSFRALPENVAAGSYTGQALFTVEAT